MQAKNRLRKCAAAGHVDLHMGIELQERDGTFYLRQFESTDCECCYRPIYIGDRDDLVALSAALSAAALRKAS